jgi:DNA-binding response OmpR family regulator
MMAAMSQSPTTDSPHVLVVDDETVLAGMVSNYLQRAGFRTTVVYDGPSAVTRALSDAPDVVVLDLGLPGKDGMEVCHEIRRHSDCYIIMLTARNEEIDKLLGLSAGADDYITKPFSARELVARVQALLRRPRAQRRLDHPERTIGALRIDPAGRRVFVTGVEVELTRTEFDLLNLLSERPKLVFSRRQLIDAVWSEDWVGDEHLVDVHIGHLRRKLGDLSDLAFVDTVRGVGYRMGPAR